MKDYITILDIGTTKIVAMIGKLTPEKKLQILGYGEDQSTGVKRGLVLNIAKVSNIITKVIKKAEIQADTKINEVFVGIAGQHIYGTFMDHSILNEKNTIITQELVNKLIAEVHEMVLQPGQKILHVFPQEYEIDDNSVIDPIGTIGKKLKGKFHISHGNETKINTLIKSVQDTGLKVKNLILEPVASATATLSKEEKEAGVMMLDIGGGTTDIIIYKNNIVKHTAVIPFGGKTITKDIAEGCKILDSQAEQLKIEHGSAIPDMIKENELAPVKGIAGREDRDIPLKTLAQIIQARTLEIIDTATFELKNSNLQNTLNAGITITGGGASLKHLRELIEFRTGQETHIAKPKNYIFTTPNAFSKPKYSTSIGLLMQGINIKQKENLKKTEIQQNTTNEQKNKNKNKNNLFEKLKNFFIDNSQEI